MATTKKTVFGLNDIGFKRGTQTAQPNLKNNRLTPAQMTPGSPSGGQMSMPTQPYSSQMSMPKSNIFGALSGGAFNRGTQQAPNLKNNRLTPAQTAPGAPSGGQMSMPLQQASQNIAPGRLGQGTPQNLPKNLPQDYTQQQENQAMQAAMGANRSNSATMTPTGPVSGGLSAGPIDKNAPTGKPFNFGSIGMPGPSIAQQVSGYKKGGTVKAAKMGAVKVAKPKAGSASSRGDGIAQRGKTKGRMV